MQENFNNFSWKIEIEYLKSDFILYCLFVLASWGFVAIRVKFQLNFEVLQMVLLFTTSQQHYIICNDCFEVQTVLEFRKLPVFFFWLLGGGGMMNF